MSAYGEHEETLAVMIAALNRGDADAVARRFAEDGVVVTFAQPSVRHCGRPEIAALVRSYFDLFPDLSVEIVTVVANGQRLAAELVLRGTPATSDKSLEIAVGAFYKFSNGEVVSEHAYLDMGHLSTDT